MAKKYLMILIGISISVMGTAQWNPSTTSSSDPIYRSGNVGIGTTSPVYPLQIEGSLSELHLLIKNTGANGARTYLTSSSGKSSIQTDKDFTIRTNYNGPWTDKFTLTNFGNVGIGTNTPKSRLDLGSLGGVMLRIHPGTQTTVNYNTYEHHDFLTGSYLEDGLSNAFISTGYVQDGRRKFHIGAANSGDFSTASFQPHFTVTSDGKVGIGTQGPTSTLHLSNSSSGSGTMIQIQSTAASQFAAVNLINNSGYAGLSIGSYGSSYPSGANYARPNGVSLHTTSNAGASAGIAIAARNSSGYITLHAGGDSERMRITANGNVGIGTTDPGSFKLAVSGKVGAREVVVTMEDPWPDHVFESNYNLPSLSELEQYIKINKHLPEVPTANEIKENGLSLGEMNAILLKKVEELTLHLIEQNKKLEHQNQIIIDQNDRLKRLEQSK